MRFPTSLRTCLDMFQRRAPLKTFFPFLPGSSLRWLTGLFLASQVLPLASQSTSPLLLMGIINSHCITRSPQGPPPLII